MASLTDIFPLLGLRIEAGPLTLSYVNDDDLPGLIDLALGGVHAPDVMPFSFPWTAAPRDELPGNTAQYFWRQRASVSPEKWHLEFAVRYDGELMGVQGLFTASGDFRLTRLAETGSWIALKHQGKGVGKAMRKVICAFAFDYLGAEVVTSSAFSDNPASNGVSKAVGYQPNGMSRKVVQGKRVDAHKYVLQPTDLVRYEHPLVVQGFDGVRRQLGLEG